MIRAWRICKSKWATTAFSGVGAAEYPGRWNLLGEKAVYCADSRSLGSLELLAHVMRKHTLSRAKFIAIAVDIPISLIFTPTRFPRGWDAKPHTNISQRFGSRWLRSHPILRVPSVVVRGEFCFVLNPLHPDFHKVKVGKAEPLYFDFRVISGHGKSDA